MVEANVIATHAYQVKLAVESGRGDPECYGPAGLEVADLEAIVSRQDLLLRSDTTAISDWLEGRTSSFEPNLNVLPILTAGLNLNPSLPVNALSADLQASTGRSGGETRSLANLYQTCLEVERDGTLLWDLYHFYIALGIPVHPGDFGYSGTDEDFLEMGRRVAGRCCESPFDTDAAAWQIAGRKVWNWADKKLHRRDRFTVAREMLTEAPVRSWLIELKSAPARKVAVIGHSFTMDSHWSSPSSFAAIVDAIFLLENPTVHTRQWFGGGLTASRALARFYEEALAWAPQQVLLAVAVRNQEDARALKEMSTGFAATGAVVYVFDTLMDPSEDAELNRFSPDQEEEWGFKVIAVREALAASPDRQEFVCLDGIHMTEPYHRIMARAWLRALLDAGASRNSAAS